MVQLRRTAVESQRSRPQRQTAEIIWRACLVGAAVTLLIDLATPELFDSIDELVEYRTALGTGKLPNGIELPRWRHHLRRSRLLNALAPLFALPYLGFGALSADMSQSPDRTTLLWMFALCGIWVFVAVCRSGAQIKQLQAALWHRQQRLRSSATTSQEAVTPGEKSLLRAQDWWRSNAETPIAERLIALLVVSSALAFLALVPADLDSVVYSDARTSRLGWVALWATATGVAVTGTVFGDPRLHATSRTIEAILQYDGAFRTAELPANFDIDQWRGWIKAQHRSDTVALIWACLSLMAGCWSILSHPSGYHLVVATLLAILAVWQLRRWRYFYSMTARLETLVQRHAIRQLFG